MRTAYHIQAQKLKGLVIGATAGRRRWSDGNSQKHLEGRAGIELVTGIARKIPTEGRVSVQHWRIGGTVQEDEISVWRRRNEDRLHLTHLEILAGLQGIAGRHIGGEYCHLLFIIIDVLDFVIPRKGEEFQIPTACEHATILRRPTSIVDCKWVLNLDAPTYCSARTSCIAHWNSIINA